jgi:hypothetical protein
MAKKKATGKAKDKRLTIDETTTVDITHGTRHEVTLLPGMELQIVEDGTGNPVDDVSKTVWQTYADRITEQDKTGDEK